MLDKKLEDLDWEIEDDIRGKLEEYAAEENMTIQAAVFTAITNVIEAERPDTKFIPISEDYHNFIQELNERRPKGKKDWDIVIQSLEYFGQFLNTKVKTVVSNKEVDDG